MSQFLTSRTVDTPPGSPTQGDTYYVPESASGAWSGQDGLLARYFFGGWNFIAPDEGGQYWIGDEDALMVYHPTAGLVELATAAGDLTWPMSFTDRPIADFNTGSVAVGDVSLDSASDYDGFTALLNWPDSQKRGCSFVWGVPEELDLTRTVGLDFWFRLGAAPSAGNQVEIEVVYRAVADNEATLDGGATGTKALTHVLTGYSSGDLVKVEIPAVIPANTLARGDLVKGVVLRDAQVGNAEDTFANTIQAVRGLWRGKRRRS